MATHLGPLVSFAASRGGSGYQGGGDTGNRHVHGGSCLDGKEGASGWVWIILRHEE